MGLNFGPQVNFGGTLPAGGQVRQDIINPRGKPSFTRRLVVTNTGAQPLTVIFPQDAVAATPEVGSTVAANGGKGEFEGLFHYFVVKGTAGQTWEATATVAG